MLYNLMFCFPVIILTIKNRRYCLQSSNDAGGNKILLIVLVVFYFSLTLHIRNLKSYIMDNNKLYPLLFEPNLHSVVWGGKKLPAWKQMPEPGEPIGESWEVSAVKSSINIIANGALKGSDLVSVINSSPEEILGKKVAAQYNNELPLLVKFIDAQRDLSIQVHPDDKMAKRVHGKNGKTEMWYILDAQPGSYLYAGFKDQIDGEEYKRRIADGTICDVLAKHEVKPGDVFYIPAGRVHAICSGILLAEVQQSSDVTYRIFDYNRPGMDGKPRELHTELAAEALNFKVEKNYRTEYSYTENNANTIIDSSFFNVRVVDTDKEYHCDMTQYDSFVIAMCLKGDCRIRIRKTGDEITLKEGFSSLIPAAIADYDIIPANKDGHTKVLDAFIGH